ncbi:MAG TPA: DMT family transporter [Thermoanaerobaculia bacterium]|nr:DMT family transporter [Thermoanaerobaculia bacterium]
MRIENDPVRLHLALFTVALLFSGNYIISKLGMREFSPMSFAWLRIAGAAAILAVIVRNEPPLSRDDTRRVAGYAILGVVINAPLFLVGLSMTSVHVAAILITTIPVFAVAAAIAFGRERASATRIGGIALACVGALLVVGGERFTGTWRSVLGATLIVINCLSYALYLVISKPAMARLSAKRVVARMFLVGTFVLVPFAALPMARQDWESLSAGAWLALGVVIIGPTIVAYLLQAWALRHADSSVVAAYTYIQPVLASVLGALVLGETLRPIVLGAAVLIFSGVALAGKSGATGSQPADHRHSTG